jgi:hypothetical protein
MIDLTKARAQARTVTTTIHCDGMPRPTFTKAIQNIATMAALSDTLTAPSTNMVGKVYHQLKDIHGTAAVQ